MNNVVGLLDSSGFMPHGHCFLWTQTLLWTFTLSDGLIMLSYYSIPAALWYFAQRRRDMPFGWILGMFSAFIFACGTTHLIAIWNIWQPVYWLDAGIKAATATISVVTAVLLWPLVPRALALPSQTQLTQANRDLEAEITRRVQVQNELRALNRQLEERVADRTAQLEAANQELRDRIAERDRALAEKTTLLNEVHHRVKNNLHLVSSLLEMQARHSTPEVEAVLSVSYSRVRSMSLIHQLLYEHGNLARIRLGTYLERLLGLLRDTYSERGKSVQTRLIGADVDIFLDMQHAIPCGLIVTELITNSFVHAFPQGRTGNITVTLKAERPGDAHLTITDDGIGIPETVKLGEGRSLGFRLLPMLADQLGGELTLVRHQGARCELLFQFSLA